MDRRRKIDIFNVVYAWIFTVLYTVISFRDWRSGIMLLPSWLIPVIVSVTIHTYGIFNLEKYSKYIEGRNKKEARAQKRLGRFYLPYRIISLVLVYSIPVWVLWLNWVRPIVDIKISIAIFICLLVWLVIVHVAERRPKKDADITAK